MQSCVKHMSDSVTYCNSQLILKGIARLLMLDTMAVHIVQPPTTLSYKLVQGAQIVKCTCTVLVRQ